MAEEQTGTKEKVSDVYDIQTGTYKQPAEDGSPDTPPSESLAPLSSMYAPQDGAENSDEEVSLDVAPRDWLQKDDSLYSEYVETTAGRLKIAALTEAEVDVLLKGSRRPVTPGDRKSAMKTDMSLFRYNMTAHSINKAAGLIDESTGQLRAGGIMPEELRKSKKLAGELTVIFNEIARISGYKREDTTPQDFFA